MKRPPGAPSGPIASLPPLVVDEDSDETLGEARKGFAASPKIFGPG
jgi:hypothetical protein